MSRDRHDAKSHVIRISTDDIECIIRETGLNQDGRMTGITMSSNVAQTTLIKGTYAKAGLDLSSADDHPQFFHAHGTDTSAGDP